MVLRYARQNLEMPGNKLGTLGKFWGRSANSGDARQKLRSCRMVHGNERIESFCQKKNLGTAGKNLFALGTKWIRVKTKRTTTNTICL